MHLQVIDETLSPTWDELLVFDEILVYGRREDIKANPPVVIIEIYDQDKVGGPMQQNSWLLHTYPLSPKFKPVWNTDCIYEAAKCSSLSKKE